MRSSTHQARGPDRPRDVTFAALASPALPMAAMTLPLTIFLPAFYAGTIGINLAIVGIIFTLVRLADLILDPLIGSLMDRTRTRWGRFKPWLVAGVPIIITGAWLLFMPHQGAGPLYLAAALVIAYTGYSMVVLSQMGIGAGLTEDYRERSRVFAWWQVFNIAGVILVLVLPPALALVTPATPRLTMTTMGISIIATLPICVAVALLLVRDRGRSSLAQRSGLREYAGLFALPSTRRLLASVMASGLALGVSSSVFVFFYTTLKHVSGQQISLLLAGWFVICICAAPAWAGIGNRLGKHRALCLGCVGTALCYVAIGLMPPGNLVYLGTAFVFGGFFACAGDLLPRAMMADVSDEIRLVSGADRTGMLYALLNVTIKLGQAIAIGVVYTVLDLVGFKAAAGMHNSAATLLSVLVLYCVIPTGLQCLAGLAAWRYPLTATRHALIRARLQAPPI